MPKAIRVADAAVSCLGGSSGGGCPTSHGSRLLGTGAKIPTLRAMGCIQARTVSGAQMLDGAVWLSGQPHSSGSKDWVRTPASS